MRNKKYIISLIIISLLVVIYYFKYIGVSKKLIEYPIINNNHNNNNILLILNCEKYYYKREKQIQSWIKDLKNNIKYFHVIGKKELFLNNNKDYIIDDKEKILYVNTNDDYISLPSKVITAFKAINENYDYDYIFKTDDDQQVDKNFWSLLTERLNKDIHYGGRYAEKKKKYHINKNKNYISEHPELKKLNVLIEKIVYCTGRFYLLSNRAIENLLISEEKIKERVLEDHAIGYYLNDEFKKNSLYFNSDEYFETKY